MDDAAYKMKPEKEKNLGEKAGDALQGAKD